jgi:hypothetical protein
MKPVSIKPITTKAQGILYAECCTIAMILLFSFIYLVTPGTITLVLHPGPQCVVLFFLGLAVAGLGTAVLEASFEAEILRNIKEPVKE